MAKKTFNGLVLSSILFGFIGCGDVDKKEPSKPTFDTTKESNGSIESNPLDKLTATLPAGLNASDARKISDTATEKLFQEFFVKGDGKEMLENSIKIINTRIEKMTQNGVFDGTNLNTFMADSPYGPSAQSDLRQISSYLKKMSDEQKELYKRLLVNYYVQKGYKVVAGQQNYQDSFHYSINW